MTHFSKLFAVRWFCWVKLVLNCVNILLNCAEENYKFSKFISKYLNNVSFHWYMFRLQKRHFQIAAVFNNVRRVLCNTCKCSIKHVILFHNYTTVRTVITVEFKNYYNTRIVLKLYCVAFSFFVMEDFFLNFL